MGTTLSHRDWLRLHEIVLDLHTAPDPGTLASGLLASLNRLCPFDIGNVQDDRGGIRRIPWRRGDEVLWQPPPATVTAGEPPPRGRRVMPTWGPDFLPLREAFFAVSAERHPHTDYFRRTGDGQARRITEIKSLRALRQTSFFHEISRPLNVVYQMTIYVPLPGGSTLTVAAARGGRMDFSAHELLVLELLRPHLPAAWQGADELGFPEVLVAPVLVLNLSGVQGTVRGLGGVDLDEGANGDLTVALVDGGGGVHEEREAVHLPGTGHGAAGGQGLDAAEKLGLAAVAAAVIPAPGEEQAGGDEEQAGGEADVETGKQGFGAGVHVMS